ncbi:PucR family transcriptional regulator [[Mycobacterium] nativiensis]|uniref:Helix-turn-helix domain-containing protein n=1 Tax=[Mycobacterium] nativiensis TaxID=2855503 RepID=A0ABU5XS66_9MYCO|nr:helix-turn-helix domain-containing protein [Mycolicibacter sp. MYC340]MEB3030812.1 helix-turn-helix domain-containing protein [Mycolicibacter sp. MYC340]
MTSAQQLRLPETVLSAMWSALPSVAERTVAGVVAEVPSYADAFSGRMGRTIGKAVQQALEGFLKEATDPHPGQGASSIGPALDGAYTLGRGEARSGRSTDVLLAAYRVGARIAWRDLSAIAVSHGLAGDALALFAELVFAYIDQLSAFSVSGHADELALTGLARQRNREQLASQLLNKAEAEHLIMAAERADWSPPHTLTAVALPVSQERGVVGMLDPRTLRAADDSHDPAGNAVAILLVPDAGGPGRSRLFESLAGRCAVIGPTRPWMDVASSVHRVMRAVELNLAAQMTVDTDDCLTDLVLRADPDALDDLRAKVLAPLADLRPTAKDKLIETLRAWLLHHGRRDDVAATLFVHPQTVRYRIGQLRELYGDKLEDPTTVLQLTLALGAAPTG